MSAVLFAMGVSMAAAAPETAASTGVRPTFRIGASGGVGGFSGPMVAHTLRVHAGAQLVPAFGVYGELGRVDGLALGGQLSSSSVGLSVRSLSGEYAAVVAEGSAGPLFLAAGPALHTAAWVTVAQSVDDQGNVQQIGVVVDGSPGFGGQARLGVRLGGKDNRATVTLELASLFLHGTVFEVAQQAGASGTSQAVAIGDGRWGVLPSFQMGFDYR